MNNEIKINKQELLKILNLLHKQLLLDMNMVYEKSTILKDIMGNKFISEILGENLDCEGMEYNIYDLDDLHKHYPHTLTIETILWSIFRILALQDETVRWCYIADYELSTELLEVSHNIDMPYAITFYQWLYDYDDDFEIFIDNMYKYLTTELNTEFSQLKAAFIDENDTINWVNEFSQFRDI